MLHPVRHALIAAVCLCALPRLASAGQCQTPAALASVAQAPSPADPDDLSTAVADVTACDRLDYESPLIVDLFGAEPLSFSDDGSESAPAMERNTPCARTSEVSACPAPRQQRPRAAAGRARVVRHPQHRAAPASTPVTSVTDNDAPATPTQPSPGAGPGAHDAALNAHLALALAQAPARFTPHTRTQHPSDPPAARLERPPRLS
ncbi:MAG: hypothetical protein IT370_29670 [Deltaproteobacteria bacterium]|nr:hypothetical protein [Deltaproteobacteria bacterium]